MNRLITSNSIGSMLSRVAGITLIIGAAAVVAAVVTNAPAAGGTSGATISAPTSDRLVSVNRANKGDRLSQAPAERLSRSSPSTEAVASPKRVPLGCDPAFSPVADPSRGTIYKRCVV
jgi:hypothetical protein